MCFKFDTRSTSGVPTADRQATANGQGLQTPLSASPSFYVTLTYFAPILAVYQTHMQQDGAHGSADDCIFQRQ